MKPNKTLSALHKFLKKKEASGSAFDMSEVLDATGWKKSTFTTYLNKGQLADFINELSNNTYEASNCIDITDVEFAKLLSQSKHRRSVASNFKSKLAKALISKSKDNMLLAVELYNRPSLDNRMDAFVMCFCTAWEQLLKATIINNDGEDAIFRKSGNLGLKETISLRDCLGRLYPTTSNIRKNIEQVAYLRDQAVHLLIPEIQGVMSRVFQSGVLNFASVFESSTQVPIFKNSHTGMISLVGEFKLPPVSVMKSTYGDIANEVIELVSSVQKNIDNSNDIEFAIPLNVKLVFASSNSEGQTVTLAKAEDGIEGLKKALVIEKPVDRSISHPLKRSKAITLINDRLHEKYDRVSLDKNLVKICTKTNRPIINTNCFEAVIAKNKWKQANNKYHYKNEDPEIHYYSHELVGEFIKKIMAHPDYLKKTKNDYNRRNLR